MLTVATIKSLLVPTDSQWRAFAEHLITIHSWYKHLPLFDGGEFVVFLAPDAGKGYPTEHPKLPTENTLSGYRRAFGYLDYVYRVRPTDPFDRDGPTAPRFDDEVFTVGRFNLYPYVSHEFYWSVHEDAVARIRNGVKHPHAVAILEAYDAEQRKDHCWDELSESDRDAIVNIDDTQTALKERSLHDSILRYLELEETASQSYWKLAQPERMKLRRSVDAVRQWLA